MDGSRGEDFGGKDHLNLKVPRQDVDCFLTCFISRTDGPPTKGTIM